ncbi:MAG: response regulator [Bacteriovoracaceae bacterium]|nr:response regulator [Bacteriovoracaceae bacterium]
MGNDEESKKFVLIVEDDPLTVVYVRTLLEPHGYEVYSVTNGKNCLQALAQYQFDLLIIDMLMPVYDGQSTTIDIKNNKDLKDIPIVIITASEEENAKDNALFAGADAFLTKPIKKDEMLKTLKQMIQNKPMKAA